MSNMHIDDRIDFRLLRYFVVVAEELHFARAAARLGIAQPPLSQHIKRLERLVGVELFERTSRRVTLTSAGATLLASTHRATSEMQQGVRAAEAIAAGQTGALTIGYAHLAMNFFLPPLIRAFRKQHPHIGLTLHGIPTSMQLEWLLAGEMDAAFVSNTEPGPGLLAHRRWTEPLDRVRARSDATDDVLLLFPRHQSPDLYDCILAVAKEVGVGSAGVQEIDSWYSIVSLVAAGLGSTIAPRSIRRYRVSGVAYQPLGRRAPHVSVTLMTRAERMSPALEAFVAEASG